jgi:hypothetical protein
VTKLAPALAAVVNVITGHGDAGAAIVEYPGVDNRSSKGGIAAIDVTNYVTYMAAKERTW